MKLQEETNLLIKIDLRNPQGIKRDTPIILESTEDVSGQSNDFSFQEAVDADNEIADSEPMDSILNLQYLFPYCDEAFNNYTDIKIIVLYMCDSQADFERVNQYVCLVPLHRPFLVLSGIYFDEKTKLLTMECTHAHVRVHTRKSGGTISVPFLGLYQ